MAASLTLMLKMTISLKRWTFKWQRIDNSKVDAFGVDGSMEHTKKSKKMFTSRNLAKSKKTFKSWKLAKSRKKSSKSGNLTNFDIAKAKPKFLTPNTKTTFNRL